jgi:hypothetical protein
VSMCRVRQSSNDDMLPMGMSDERVGRGMQERDGDPIQVSWRDGTVKAERRLTGETGWTGTRL